MSASVIGINPSIQVTEHLLLKPWMWCGHQWKHIQHFKEGGTLYKIAQLSLKLIPAAGLALATTGAILPAFVGSIFTKSSYLQIEMTAPLKNQCKQLEKNEIQKRIDPIIQHKTFILHRKENYNFHKINLIPSKTNPTAVIEIAKSISLGKSLSNRLRILKNSFLYNKSVPFDFNGVQNLLLGTDTDNEKRDEWIKTANSCKNICLYISENCEHMELQVAY